ncbi:FRG domain-containing protein [Sphingomonas canadensis]|uniref:FRG domain-containing protein n=1 Tax=Sphingomonas canadensis TaxID=1219257 RepID=A0ABW3HAE4_9SPHN|nr:FRG domain-containing protein [Sphingomonas canadensis]MCW3838202.1 FRG domain-containing protein [Sphingomonas canadensis]
MTAIGTPESPIKSVGEFVDCLSQIEKFDDSFIFYRGHADMHWDLLPSIMRCRDNIADNEHNIIREIISKYPYDFDQEYTTFDRLARLQHYGISTRLLDITKSPLVALYFATENIGTKNEPNGAVLALGTPASRRKFFDSDTVSCMSNLAYLSSTEKKILAETKSRTIAEFNELKPARRLLQFIKAEKPYFDSSIIKMDLHFPLIVIPKLRNPRIVAQHGCFMIFGLDKKIPSERKGNTSKIIVSGDHKQKIRNELDDLGINMPALFPEIDKLSSHIMANYA